MTDVSRKVDKLLKDNSNVTQPYNSIDLSTMTPLQKHIEYFDRNKDGILTPIETWVAFRALGYNIIMTLLAIFLIHGTMSYASLDSWIPDIFFRIYIKNIRRCKHGSDTGMYDHKGLFIEKNFEKIVKEFSSTNEYFTYKEIWNMTEQLRVANDFYGWIAAKFEWTFFYVLCQQNGKVHKNYLLGLIDGSLFYEIEKRNHMMRTNKKEL